MSTGTRTASGKGQGIGGRRWGSIGDSGVASVGGGVSASAEDGVASVTGEPMAMALHNRPSLSCAF